MYKFFKRLFDVCASLLGLIIAAIPMLLVALLIKIDSKGPVIFKQKRLGLGAKEFYIYKFRSMIVDAEKSGVYSDNKDKRLTRVGKILRKTSVDELPQLINILKGDMSIVGPRPERRVIADEYLKVIPEFDMRLKVRAGLTGYAQVYGRYNTTPYDKLKIDITYIENYSFWLDIKIMFLTFKILFQKENTEGVEEEQITAIKK